MCTSSPGSIIMSYWSHWISAFEVNSANMRPACLTPCLSSTGRCGFSLPGTACCSPPYLNRCRSSHKSSQLTDHRNPWPPPAQVANRSAVTHAVFCRKVALQRSHRHGGQHRLHAISHLSQRSDGTSSKDSWPCRTLSSWLSLVLSETYGEYFVSGGNCCLTGAKKPKGFSNTSIFHCFWVRIALTELFLCTAFC